MNKPFDSNTSLPNPWRFCIAPMMDWSDRHCRYFWRLLTRQARLYTEMVTTGALLQGDAARHLQFSAVEKPLALQLGGSDPAALAQCAELAEEWGYDEVNLNCGCPSDRVQTGRIGAILMAEPELVAECVAAMRAACSIPVTVKHRIGIDDMEEYDDMEKFVAAIAHAGCSTFIVHARKAWLKGLSPKENREVPPLKYELVFKLKQAFPALNVIINGGITTLEQCETLLQHVDGVMIGREAYQNPWLLGDLDARLFAAHNPAASAREAAQNLLPYIKEETASGTRLHHISRHVLGLFSGQPGARQYRRYLSEHATRADADVAVFEKALSHLAP